MVLGNVHELEGRQDASLQRSGIIESVHLKVQPR